MTSFPSFSDINRSINSAANYIANFMGESLDVVAGVPVGAPSEGRLDAFEGALDRQQSGTGFGLFHEYASIRREQTLNIALSGFYNGLSARLSSPERSSARILVSMESGARTSVESPVDGSTGSELEASPGTRVAELLQELSEFEEEEPVASTTDMAALLTELRQILETNGASPSSESTSRSRAELLGEVSSLLDSEIFGSTGTSGSGIEPSELAQRLQELMEILREESSGAPMLSDEETSLLVTEIRQLLTNAATSDSSADSE